ncbi:MAG: VOC family protein [Cohaesibacteraceae bacterium]
MTDRLLDIDHLMINVPNAQRAGEMFEALGFTVTPLSAMPGLENRLVCFPDTAASDGVCNYIELMGLTDANTAPPPMPDLLSRPFGPVSTVLCASDARAVRARLVASGMRLGSVLDLQRDWHLPSGEVITPAFSVAIPDLDQSPFYWNYCQHKTPHHYVRPDFTNHTNSVTRLKGVIAVHNDPDEAAIHYETMWQTKTSGRDPVTIKLNTVDLEIHTPQGFARQFELEAPSPGLIGMRLETPDLQAARSAIGNVGVAARDVQGGLLIEQSGAADTLVIIEAKT